MKVKEVVAELLKLDQEAEIEEWCGGDYGTYSIESVESPVILNKGSDSERIIDEGPGTVVVCFR